MPTVTYNSETFTCTTALKGKDYIHLLDASGHMTTAFDGVVDFSGFSITDGDWTSPTDLNECYLAVVEDDGSINICDTKACDIPTTAADIGAADANHTHTPASIGAAAESHTHTYTQIGLTDEQVRKITITDTSVNPSGGKNGDLWFRYKTS